jgi:hypothetical protein
MRLRLLLGSIRGRCNADKLLRTTTETVIGSRGEEGVCLRSRRADSAALTRCSGARPMKSSTGAVDGLTVNKGGGQVVRVRLRGWG